MLHEAGEWTASILAGDQDTSRSTSRAACRRSCSGTGSPSARTTRGSTDAVGWLRCARRELPAGDHTLFVGEVLELERGPGDDSLVYLDRRYTPL